MTQAAAPPPRRRRRWLRRLGIAGLLLLAVAAAAPLALGIAPVRRFIAQQASDALGRRVTIGGLSAAWWSGIEVRDLEIHNPDGWTGDPLLAVERIRADVGWWSLLRGTLDARVEVDRPAVTLIRGADGRANTDGLGETARSRDRERKRGEGRPKGRGKEEPPAPRLVLLVRDGTLQAFGAPGSAPTRPERIEGIAVDAQTWPDGRVEGSFRLSAKDARAGGGDAAIEGPAPLAAGGRGPVALTVAPLDLARLGKTLGAALGVEEVAGSLEARADLVLDGHGGATGTATATARDLRWRRGTRSVAARSVVLQATPTAAGAAIRGEVGATVEGLRLEGFSTREPVLEEPSLRLAGTIRREENGDLRFGESGAPLRLDGRIVNGRVSGAVTGLSGDTPEADLALSLALALSPTLGRLVGALAAPDDDLRGTVTIDAAVRGTGGVLDVRATGEAKGLVVGGSAGTDPWREPSATLSVEGRWDGPTRTLTLSNADLAAGAVRASVTPPFTVRGGERPSVTGDASLVADLSRLASLRAMVPELGSVQGGTIQAVVRASGGEDLVLGWSVRGSNLAFAPGSLSSRGHLERDVVAQGRFERPSRGDAVVTVERLTSSIASLAEGGPVRVRLAPAGPAIDGNATVDVNLEAAGTAFDRALALGPGDTLRGTLRATASGSATPGGARFEVRLQGRDLLLPRTTGPGTIDGKVVVRMDDAAKSATVEEATLKGYGLDLLASATIGPGEDGARTLTTAKLAATGDLEGARPLLWPALGLEPDATAAGTLRCDVTVKASGAGRVVEGRTTVQRFRYRGAPDRTTGHATSIDEPVVTLEHRIVLDARPGLVQVERLVLASDALSADAKGTVRRAGKDADLDLSGSLRGEASVLAGRLRRALGPDYDDATGEGRVEGSFHVAGSTAEEARDLRLDANLTFRRFSSGGLALEDGRLVAARPDARSPLRVTIVSRVNGGTLDAGGNARLGEAGIPWDAKVVLQGVDTSPLLVNRGTGRYLALVLPAIVPADATAQVLSGRLDGEVEVRSASIHAPASVDGLTGRGQIHMHDGAVKDSTLFAGLERGKGMTQLLSLVPGVGSAFDDLTRAVTFQEMSSTFTLANRQVHLDPVLLVSPAVDLQFKGVVGFDGRMDLRIPLRIGGQAGQAMEKFVPDRTIPLRVRGEPGKKPRVTPDLKLEGLGKGLLDDLLKGRGK